MLKVPLSMVKAEMNKITLFRILVVLILTVGAYFVWERMSKQTPNGDQGTHNSQNPGSSSNTVVSTVNSEPDSIESHGNIQQIDSVPLDSKKYTSENIGVSFQYPASWSINDENVNAIDLSGAVISKQSDFIDTATNSSFSIIYHVSPWGMKLYQYALSKYNASKGTFESDRNQIEVAGYKALEGFTLTTTDGKGHTINPPLRSILIYFLDSKQGEFELQFTTPVDNYEKEITKFNYVLSTLKTK